MFTGIVKGLFKISAFNQSQGILKLAITFTDEMLQGLQTGASVAVNGTCLTVVKIENHRVWFDAIPETLHRTNLKFLDVGQLVNVERSAKFGDEIGGHVLSGHIIGTAEIVKVHLLENNRVMTFETNPDWMKYFFPKGYIAVDGVSLTLVDVDHSGTFTVHLIPETLRLTTLGFKKEGDLVNIELDSQTQTIVDTIERIMKQKGLMNGK